MPSEWKPIESSPKDATSVLLGREGETTMTGWWQPFHKEWRFADSSMGCGPLWFAPTHWMPLPEPPHAKAVQP